MNLSCFCVTQILNLKEENGLFQDRFQPQLFTLHSSLFTKNELPLRAIHFSKPQKFLRVKGAFFKKLPFTD